MAIDLDAAAALVTSGARVQVADADERGAKVADAIGGRFAG